MPRVAGLDLQLRAIAHRQAVVAYVGAGTSADDSAGAEDWAHTSGRADITSSEVALAKRCHGAHLELLRREITPIGSHYLLIHYDVPHDLDAKTHVLRVHGLVDQTQNLSLEHLRARPPISHTVVLECAGQGRMLLQRRLWPHVPWGVDAFGCATWTGCSLADVLRAAAPRAGAVQVVFTGADCGVEDEHLQHFERSLSLEDALSLEAILAYEMNGAELAPAHGYPLRLIVPGWYGMASVKWLTSIELTDGSWHGHQMDAYVYARSANDPERIAVQYQFVRALMAPPGVPDFFTRARLVCPGICRVVGKAWAGVLDVSSVQFSADGGATWLEATMDSERNGSYGWRSWHFDWEAAEGTHVLSCRAFDSSGAGQDSLSERQFNYTSMGCTQPQQVYVRVAASVQQLGGHVSLAAELEAAKPSRARQSPSAALSKRLTDALFLVPGSQ